MISQIHKERENIKFILKTCLQIVETQCFSTYLIRNNHVGKWRRIVANLPTKSTTMITVFWLTHIKKIMILLWRRECVCKCCLTPLWNVYSYIMTITSYLFDEMIMMSALLELVLVYWNNSPRVGISLHSNTLFLFSANQSLVFLLSDAWFAEKQNIPIK
jgi:hypothetical protein